MGWPLASRSRVREQELGWNTIADPVLDTHRWGRVVEQAIRDLDYHFAEQQAKRKQYTIPIREYKR